MARTTKWHLPLPETGCSWTLHFFCAGRSRFGRWIEYSALVKLLQFCHWIKPAVNQVHLCHSHCRAWTLPLSHTWIYFCFSGSTGLIREPEKPKVLSRSNTVPTFQQEQTQGFKKTLPCATGLRDEWTKAVFKFTFLAVKIMMEPWDEKRDSSSHLFLNVIYIPWIPLITGVASS